MPRLDHPQNAEPDALLLGARLQHPVQDRRAVRDEAAQVGLEDDMQGAAHGARPFEGEAEIGRRAEGYYKSAHMLLPLIDRESQPAMLALVTIYHRLLERIRRADYDVFSSRASVPMVQKLGVLAVAQARMALARLFV